MSRRSTKRKSRVSSMKDRVAKHAKESQRSNRYLILPDGVETFFPKEKGRHAIDIIPYVVSVDNHQDDVEKGELWYRRPYWIHYIERKPVVCPSTIGKKCPICEEVDRLAKDYDSNKDAIGVIKRRLMCLFNVVDPTDKKKKIKVFDWSAFKFADVLEKELNEGEVENCAFADLEGGMTVHFRVSEDSFAGNKFLKTGRIDFKDRPDYDDSILDDVVNLDEALRVLPYDTIAKMFFADEEEDDKPSRSKNKKKKPARSSRKDDDEEEEDDDEEEDDEEEEEEDDDEEEDDEEEEEEDDEEEDEEEDDEEEDEEDDEEEEEDDEEEEEEEDEEEDDEEEDEEEDDEEEDEEDDEEDDKKGKKKGKKNKKPDRRSRKDEEEDDEEDDDDEEEDDEEEDDEEEEDDDDEEEDDEEEDDEEEEDDDDEEDDDEEDDDEEDDDEEDEEDDDEEDDDEEDDDDKKKKGTSRSSKSKSTKTKMPDKKALQKWSKAKLLEFALEHRSELKIKDSPTALRRMAQTNLRDLLIRVCK